MTAERFDAFVSYGHGDADWAGTLAGNLERLGLHVFLDAWELVAGDLIAVRLQDGLAGAGAVVFVVSPESVSRGWVKEEFAAAIAAVTAGQQRLIPVLIGEVALPPLVASRLYIDFRDVDDPAAYEARVRQLVAAVRGKPTAARPEPGEGIVVPPSAYRAEGPRLARLTIGADEVAFTTGGQMVRHRPAGLDARARAVLGELEGDRAQPGGQLLRAAAAGSEKTALHAALVQAGAELGRCFLGGDAGAALAAEVAAAALGNAALRLGIDTSDSALAGLPWETLVLPGQVTPLVLQERVEVYRTAALGHPPAAIQVRGPLRILAVIASPDTDGGELLDYEAELAAIVDAVHPARRGEGAYVQVLNWGSLAAIRSALLARRFHVLHVSCHARPGVLLLEDAAGRGDRVSAERFVAEGLPADRGVPLVVLAGCSTAAAGARDRAGQSNAVGQGEDGLDGSAVVETAGALEGFARDLLGRGVPAVLAMTAPVTDRYATAFAAEVYRELAGREDPVPLAALADARRAVEARRRALPPEDPWSAIAEWATPVLVQAGPALALFRRADGLEQLTAEAAPVLDPAMVVRRVGEFVGRRAELRQLLGVLRGGGAGVVLHGIGGVGKSTLAAQLIDQLGADRGLVVPVTGAGTLTVDLVLETLRTRLLAHVLTAGLAETDPLRQVAAALTDARPPWRDRLELIRQLVLSRLPVLLLVDNAEDLLTPHGHGRYQLADPDLARFLAVWVQAAPQARLICTSRYSFTLPDSRERRLHWHHLGPLSLAETRKLIWRQPALDALPLDDQQRAYTIVGGHPRTLEYLDALLRGGTAVFPDVADRIDVALKRRGIPDPRRWLTGVKGDLDQALAETITLAADDVLLDRLLDRLQDAPPARELLSGLAVYRLPVDETGVAWQLSTLTAVPNPPEDMVTRLMPIFASLQQARRDGTGRTVEDLGLEPDALAQYQRDLDDLTRPPVRLTAEAGQALGLLDGLGLVAPVSGPATEGEPPVLQWVVHRWTATALRDRTAPAAVTAAHRRAAAYWRWRVMVWPQSRAEDIEQLLEARYHYHAAGDLDHALDANEEACLQLRTWGARITERRLWEETLSWVSPRSRSAAAIVLALGNLAMLRGDYQTAEQRYQQSLAILETLGGRADLATIYHQLGVLAYNRGDYGTAEQRYQQSLAIEEEQGNRFGIATSYHQLGMLAHSRGDYGTAEQRYQATLALFEELGDRAGLAASYHQLGTLAQARGDYGTAEQRYQQSLAIKKELGDRAGLATSYHQLGILAQARGDYGTAEQRYQQSLAIKEELGDRAGLATSYGQLGILAQARGDYETAEQRYQTILALFEELGDRSGIAKTYHQLGMLAHDRRDYDAAEQRYQQSLAIKEELGDRSGIASSCHQLGMLARARGDNTTAERRYQQALAIEKELGDRSGVASTLSELGILRTDQGRHAEAIGYQIDALVTRVDIDSPMVDIDVRMLHKQRAALGDEQFLGILNTLVDEDTAAALMRITKQDD